jgi:hypothetical protein
MTKLTLMKKCKTFRLSFSNNCTFINCILVKI